MTFSPFAKRNKYKAVRTGDGFPSKLEAALYALLQMRQANGEISDLKRQQVVVLQDGAPDVKINWKVDFSFIDNETKKLCYAEAKGIETEDYKLKLKLWRFKKPFDLEVWSGSYSRLYLKEKVKAEPTWP